MLSKIVKTTLCVGLIAVFYKFLINPSFNDESVNDGTIVNFKSSDASLLIKKHSELYGNAHVIKVTQHVYVAVGFALANMIMIEGSDGIIIIDTTESEKACLKIYEEFRKITEKPLKAIIITHFHADHIIGAAALLDNVHQAGRTIDIFMHSTTAFELKRFKSSFDIAFKRSGRQFGFMLKPGDHLDSGIGPLLHFNPGADYRIVKATKTFESKETFKVAGIEFTLIHTPGETDDQTTVWIPEWRIAMTADNIYEAFPNLYAIRGSPPRDCDVWFKSLDVVRRLRAEYVVPSHGNPLIGEENIFDTITHYRDAIQFVHDQTIRLMNKGLEIDEIVEKVRLPPVLATHPFLQEFYGKVSWSVRSVFSGQLGWFSGDPVHLNPLSNKKRAKKLVEFLESDFDNTKTGLEKLLAAAEKNLEQIISHFNSTGIFLTDEAQWSLELAANAIKASDNNIAIHTKAKKVAARCLNLLGFSTTNSNARNYYLTYAKELGNGLNIAISKIGRTNVILNSQMDDIMSQFPYRFMAEFCDDRETLTVVFLFSDIKQSFAFVMRHCVLEYINDPVSIPKEFDAKLTVSSIVWKDIITNKRSALTAYASGDVELEGSMLYFKRLMDKIDRD